MTQLEIKNILNDLKLKGCITGYRFYRKKYGLENCSFEISYQDYHCGMSYRFFENIEQIRKYIKSEAEHLKDLVEGRGFFNQGWNALSEKELRDIQVALWERERIRDKDPYENKIAEKINKIIIWKRRLFLDGKAS